MVCKNQGLLKFVFVFSSKRSYDMFVMDLNKIFDNLKILFILEKGSLIVSVESLLIKCEGIESFVFNYFSFIKFMFLFEIKSSEGVKYILIFVSILQLNVDFDFYKYKNYQMIGRKREIIEDILNINLEDYSFNYYVLNF